MSVSPTPTPTPGIPSAVSAVAQSVMLVAATLSGGTLKSGSGFVISSTPTSTQIITAAHVVDGAQSYGVYPQGARGPRIAAKVVKIDDMRDVALLSIAGGGYTPLQVAPAQAPLAGAAVAVFGYPTTQTITSGATAATQRISFGDLKLVSSVGKTDGETENGESLLFNLTMTHGDSGAPIVDIKGGKVIGMALGLAAGYGAEQWMTGDGLGLSTTALRAFLDVPTPDPSAKKPAFWVATHTSGSSDLGDALRQLSQGASFLPVDVKRSGTCADSFGNALANATITEAAAPTQPSGVEVSMEVADCSGQEYYRDDITGGNIKQLALIINRTFLGYVDAHRDVWTTLLRYGVAIDPKTNPYIALMHVARNDYGQLLVTNLFHGGPADAAGVRAGDAVLKIDGRPTHGLSDALIGRLLNQPAVTLLIDRRQKIFSVRLGLRRFRDLTANGPIPR